MHNHIDYWKGKHIFASIGEPWDFISSAGDNKLTGIVQDSLFNENFSCILCTVSPFIYNNIKIDTLIVQNRRGEVQKLSIENALSRNGIEANFYFKKDGSPLNLEDFFHKKISKENISFLIGTIYLK